MSPFSGSRNWMKVAVVTVGVPLALWIVWRWINPRIFGTSSRGGAAPGAVTAEKAFRARLFFVSADGTLLVPVDRQVVSSEETSERIQRTLLELIAGPSGGQRLNRLLPEDTRLLNVFLDKGGRVVLNFGREIRNGGTQGIYAEWLMTTGILATVMRNFPQVTRVDLLVEGQVPKSVFRHVRGTGPFEIEEALIKR